jgi:hypothetical protein
LLHLGAARCNTRDVLAAVIVLTTGDVDVGPGPVGAGVITADDDDVVSIRVDSAGAGDVLNGEVGDGDARCHLAVEITAVVVLLNEDTIAG